MIYPTFLIRMSLLYSSICVIIWIKNKKELYVDFVMPLSPKWLYQMTLSKHDRLVATQEWVVLYYVMISFHLLCFFGIYLCVIICSHGTNTLNEISNIPVELDLHLFLICAYGALCSITIIGSSMIILELMITLWFWFALMLLYVALISINQMKSHICLLISCFLWFTYILLFAPKYESYIKW